MKILTIIILSLVMFVSGCTNFKDNEGKFIGGTIGTGAGAGIAVLANTTPVGAAAITAGGLLFGVFIGSHFDPAEFREYDRQQLYNALQSKQVGQLHQWYNDDTKIFYKVRISRLDTSVTGCLYYKINFSKKREGRNWENLSEEWVYDPGKNTWHKV